MSYILDGKQTPSVEFLSAKEKFELLPPDRRKDIIHSMQDEEAARLAYDWEWNGRPKQLAPDYRKSRATSFCMCSYLKAQSTSEQKLRLEDFPSCDQNTSVEALVKDDGTVEFVEVTEPKVCQFRTDWSVWVLLAGRGFGKTRVGAELVRHMVETNQAKRVHIIAPTSADARDVAVEGESGLLNISPPWNRPLYEPTKRRLTWPNGAVATLFSAEEADRLRGPQCDLLWCFIEGTLIETEFGPRPIEQIAIGDLVWTRQGLKKVYDARCTGVRPVASVIMSNGCTLTGTLDHKVMTKTLGWLELHSLPLGATLYSFKEYLKCGSRTEGERTPQNSAGISQTEMDSPCIGMSMKTKSVRFLKDTIFTIKTAISTIITPLILKPSLDLSICEHMDQEGLLPPLQNRNESTPTNSGQTIRDEQSPVKTAGPHFLQEIREPDGAVKNVLKKDEQKGSFISRSKRTLNVLVENASRYLVHLQNVLTVLPNVILRDMSSQVRVLSVEQGLSPTMHSVLAQKNVRIGLKSLVNLLMAHCGNSGSASIKSRGFAEEKRVWNLSVEDAHEYFANGVLVKNCDELAAWDLNEQQSVWDMAQFGLRLGKNPRAIVTTTPKPTILIQNLVKQAKDPLSKTIITTGSTYENRSNLAKPFMRQITQYEGTNLGRQEIYAELIDIEESGILKRTWFKKWAANKPLPNLEFVIQSYDTAFTERTENDPTGCITFGVFRPSPEDPHCIMVLDAWTEHLKYPELRKKAQDEYRCTYGDQDAPVDLLLIEEKGSGIPLIQDLQRAGLPIKKYNPGRPDKTMRLHSVSHLVYNGRVYIPESKKVPGEYVSWAEPFLREVCSFPNSPHDEYVDCLSQALAMFRDQEWIRIDAEPEKDPYEDEPSWSQEYVNPYAV